MGAAVKVLEGRNDEVQQDLGRRMETAAERLEFEEAARLRDQLANLKALQAQQIVTAGTDHDADVIAVASGSGEFCVALMFIRGGRSLGSTTFFPRAPFADTPEVLAQFIGQYYLEREVPPEILVERDFEDMQVFESTLAARCGHKVRIASAVRGLRARWLDMMRNNAEQALKTRQAGAVEHRIWPGRPARGLQPGRAAGPHGMFRHFVTPGGRTPWPRAWSSGSRVRSRTTIGDSTSPGSGPATTTRRCIRR